MRGRRSIPTAMVVVAVWVGSCGSETGTGDTASITAGTVSTTLAPVPAASGADVDSDSAGEPVTEEVRFTAGGFELVGDLSLPARDGPHPAVIVVHGSGPQTRTSTPGTTLVQQRFGDAGFAVLVWDKPGSGESTGEFDEGETLRQRAAILAEGVAFLAGHEAIDADRIGLWGLSQAGWVMPLALELTDDVAFMISVSGGGEDSIEQLAYQIGQQLICERGITDDEAELVEFYGPRAAKSRDYDDYVEAMEVLLQIDGTEQFVGDETASEDEWQPWPADIDAYFDPMTVIADTTIPVLAVFGEMDRYVDPEQGAAAYEQALHAAGNERYQVELLPDTGHTMGEQDAMCGQSGATSATYIELLDDWIEMLATSTEAEPVSPARTDTTSKGT